MAEVPPAKKYIPVSGFFSRAARDGRLDSPNYEDCQKLLLAKTEDDLRNFRSQFTAIWARSGNVIEETLDDIRLLHDAMQAVLLLKYRFDEREGFGRSALENLGFRFTELYGRMANGTIVRLSKAPASEEDGPKCYEASYRMRLGSGAFREYTQRLVGPGQLQIDARTVASHDGGELWAVAYSGYKTFSVEGDYLVVTLGFVSSFSDSECLDLIKRTIENILMLSVSGMRQTMRLGVGKDGIWYPKFDCAATAFWYLMAAQWAGGRELGVCKREGCNTVFIRSKPRNPAKARLFCCDACKRAYYAAQRKAHDGER